MSTLFSDPYAESPILPAEEQAAIDRAQARALAAQLVPGDEREGLIDRVIGAGSAVVESAADLADRAAGRLDETINKAKDPPHGAYTAAGAIVGGLLGLPLGPVGGILGGALGGWAGSRLEPTKEGK